MASAIITKIQNIFFPSRCVFCDEVMDYRTLYCVCDKCSEEIKPFYTIDGHFMFLGKIRSAILRFKFAKCTDYAETFGLIMAAQLKLRLGGNLPFDIVIPVPLAKKRYQKRGYNQSELLSKVIARELNIDFCANSLVKIKETDIQSTLGGKSEREKNIKGAFAIQNNNLKGKRILLIDDVQTTGSTIEECSKTLLKQGKAASVYPWVFAKVEE